MIWQLYRIKSHFHPSGGVVAMGNLLDLNLSTVKRFGFITRSYSGNSRHCTEPTYELFSCHSGVCLAIAGYSWGGRLLFSDLVPLHSDKDYKV